MNVRETPWVLIVDDDQDIREVLMMVFSAHGINAGAAASGEDALQRVRNRHPPALVVLDLMMPGLSGTDFLRRLKADPALAGVRVVVLSGNPAARDRARELGADGCLVKPVEMDELLEVVRRLLEGSAARAPSAPP